jgi:lipopolysaccharide transport system permease protein
MRTIITSGKKPLFTSLVVKYKDLLLTLTWRDFKVRYAQTSMGLLWAFIQPIATISILSLVFGKFIGVNVGVPHLLYTVTGMSIWTYFSYVLSNAGSSIIANQGMVKKIYFPRLIIPLSKAIIGLIDFGITLIVLISLFIYYQIIPNPNVWAAPFFLIIGIMASLAAGIWLSALTVRYRDFQHVVPFIVQLGLYISPVAYPSEFATQHLPSWAAKIYFMNPIAGVIQGFRWSLFGGILPHEMMWYSFGMVILLLITGLRYFNRIESEMADYV